MRADLTEGEGLPCEVSALTIMFTCNKTKARVVRTMPRIQDPLWPYTVTNVTFRWSGGMGITSGVAIHDVSASVCLL